MQPICGKEHTAADSFSCQDATRTTSGERSAMAVRTWSELTASRPRRAAPAAHAALGSRVTTPHREWPVTATAVARLWNSSPPPTRISFTQRLPKVSGSNREGHVRRRWQTEGARADRLRPLGSSIWVALMWLINLGFVNRLVDQHVHSRPQDDQRHHYRKQSQDP